MRFQSLFLLAPLLAAVLPLHAQDGAEENDKPSGRRAWFVATAIPDGLDNPVKILTGTQVTELTLSRRMASEAVAIPPDGIIRLVKPAPDPVAPGEVPFVTLAQVTIPESVGEALVILVPGPPEDAPQVFRTRVQNLALFKGGDTLYMNLTKARVAVKVGDKNIPLNPGAVRIFEAPRLTEPVNTPISYHFFHPAREQWKLLSASTVVMQPTRREICIFSWDPRFNRIDYHGITFPVTP